MAITVKEDIVYGSGMGLAPEGPEATRVFIATATNGEKHHDILSDANIPDLFDAYPYNSSPIPFAQIYVLDIASQLIDENNNQYRVTVTYGLPDPYQKEPGTTADDAVIQIGSSLTTSKTSVDKDGARITVSLSTESEDQVGELDIQVPELVIQFERRESTSPGTNARTYTGKVNSVALDGSNYPIRTLLCLGIDGTTTDDGVTWTVTYRFQYRPLTWAATALYTDDQGRPHPDIDLTVSPYDGAKSVNVLQEADFTNLNLPFDAT